MPTTASDRTYSPVQIGAGVVGATFLLVGIAGFIPGLTSHFSDLTFAGRDSHAELLGTFQVSVLHNIVHLLFGVLGLMAMRTMSASRIYLIVGGLVYLALTLYGAVIDLADKANFVPVNTADNWLHLALGVGMIALGLILVAANRTAVEPGTAGRGGRRTLSAEGRA
jgi:hypothetical protein